MVSTLQVIRNWNLGRSKKLPLPLRFCVLAKSSDCFMWYTSHGGEVFRPTIIHLQIVEALESHARQMVSLYQPFMSFSREDQDDEVYSNSVFGLGVLAKKGLPEMAG